MFAVVDILGNQFKVTENRMYYVPRLKDEVDSEVTFKSVLVVGDEKKVRIGNPAIKGAKVTAKVLEHLKDEKVIVFKKKRRKSYKKKRGHRQDLSKIEILKIS